MERLTRRVESGIAIYNTPSGDPVKWEHNRHKVLQKLAEYEDTGLTPEEILDRKMLTGWIPCSEKLPDSDGVYLATIDGEIVGDDKPFAGLAEFEKGRWIDDEEGYQCIIAWHPLPEPYKAESQNRTFSGGKKVNEKYTWTKIGTETDDIWRHDVFSSVEECVKDAIGYEIKPGEKIAVGICKDYVPGLSADRLLDQVSEDAYEEVGEVAEDWPEFEPRKGYRDVDKLQEKLEKAFNEWLEETNQVPGFYHVQPLADLVMIPEA